MIAGDHHAHWDNVYASRRETEVSWYQESPLPSLALVARAGVAADAPVIDIGGGASRLVDELVARGFGDVTVLDLSAAALTVARARLGDDAAPVAWIVADITAWTPPRCYALWHDRAAFHFLTDEADRARYVACLASAVGPGGHAVIATFAPDGPARCSGLPVVRYDAATLAATLGDGFALLETRRHRHVTPGGAEQSFQYTLFRRTPQ